MATNGNTHAHAHAEDESRIWLITGTSSGFGRRLVTSALARGDRVIATARSQQKLDNLVALCGSHLRSNLRTVELDITEPEDSVRKKIDDAAAIWGRIDVLVNNAGIGYPGVLEEGGNQLLRRQFDTNVFGIMSVTNAALPHLRKSPRNDATLVVIGSRSAWKTNLVTISSLLETSHSRVLNNGRSIRRIKGCNPRYVPPPVEGAVEDNGIIYIIMYMSNANATALTETLMTELAPLNIRVLLVEPGSFRTEGIYGQQFTTANTISAYDEIRSVAMKRFASVSGTEKGDPDKAMEAVVDVVRGEGVAKGRPFPPYLVLGHDAEDDIRNKCARVLANLDAWQDVSRGVNFS